MIVNYTEIGWQIITQRSHGLLAGQLCGNWKLSLQPERWIETLIAAAEHDDVYNEFEQTDLLNENGGPVNYTMTTFCKADCDRLMNMALTKSAYIALLTARHIQFVHGKETAAKLYCASLKKREKEWMKVSGVNATQVSQAYELLEFCDAFSLLICQGLVQPESRKMEISEGPDEVMYQVSSAKENYLEVTPWPFEQQTIRVSYESRIITQLVFEDNKQFLEALNRAQISRHELIISAGN